MVLLCYDKNMTIDKHHILKTSKKQDKMDILVLKNPNIFKDNNSDDHNANTFNEDFNIKIPNNNGKKNDYGKNLKK